MVPDSQVDPNRVLDRLQRDVARLRIELEKVRTGVDRVTSHGHPTDELVAVVSKHVRSSQLLADDLRDLLQCYNLRRAGEHQHGRCFQCGNPISAERLHTLPHATLCTACVRM